MNNVMCSTYYPPPLNPAGPWLGPQPLAPNLNFHFPLPLLLHVLFLEATWRVPPDRSKPEHSTFHPSGNICFYLLSSFPE